MDGIEHIRKRPGMYIGRDRPLLAPVRFALDALLEQAPVGRDMITVTLRIGVDGSVELADDGPGLPLADRLLDPIAERSPDTADRPPTGPLFGGLIPANALSAHFVIDTTSDGFHWTRRYRNGRPVSRSRTWVDVGGGTVVQLVPDRTILDGDALPADLAGRPADALLLPRRHAFASAHGFTGPARITVNDERSRGVESWVVRRTGG